ncbi:MAG: amino acid transporter [bacterium]
MKKGENQNAHIHATFAWYMVLCLTGVDYFSTLGYQPSIAYNAVGVLTPIATAALIIVTLTCAYPVYAHVADNSYSGKGSISMIESQLTGWMSKIVVLVLIGSAATDFIITITLSASDAAEHIVSNPLFSFLHGKSLLVTCALVLLLGGVFYKGFKEAMGIAVSLVVIYLGLNAIVVVSTGLNGAFEFVRLEQWWNEVRDLYPTGGAIALETLLKFPKLALGLSGFETGVAVMMLISYTAVRGETIPLGRIRNTRKLLLSAALIMSVYLIASSFAVTLMIPAKDLIEGGSANGRALSWLAHKYIGESFGLVYDLSTVGILWFAGASAFAAMLQLIPGYLPKFGMAPDAISRTRPLVVAITLIALAVVWIFDANVDAQGGAYATGVLILMSSAAIAVVIVLHKSHKKMLSVFIAFAAVVFVYTTVMNVIERPDGIRIVGVFVISILVSSFVSRMLRSNELRVESVCFDDAAMEKIACATSAHGNIRIVAHNPDHKIAPKVEAVTQFHGLLGKPFLILEVILTNPSDFASTCLYVEGKNHAGQNVLQVHAPAAANAIVAIANAIAVANPSNKVRLNFEWAEGGILSNSIRFILFGSGEIGLMVRNIIQRAVTKEVSDRIYVHVAG